MKSIATYGSYRKIRFSPVNLQETWCFRHRSTFSLYRKRKTERLTLQENFHDRCGRHCAGPTLLAHRYSVSSCGCSCYSAWQIAYQTLPKVNPMEVGGQRIDFGPVIPAQTSTHGIPMSQAGQITIITIRVNRNR